MQKAFTNDHERGLYISDLDAAQRKGLITWPSCRQAQREAMPICETCQAQPSLIRHEGRAVCEACYTAATGDPAPRSTLDQYLDLCEQQAHLIAHREGVTAELRRLHTAARPLHQELLRTMTLAELDAAFNARCAAILGHPAKRPTE